MTTEELLNDLDQIRDYVHDLAELSINNDWRKYGQVETEIIEKVSDIKAAIHNNILGEA